MTRNATPQLAIVTLIVCAMFVTPVASKTSRAGQSSSRDPPSIAVLDFSGNSFAAEATAALCNALSTSNTSSLVLDRGMARAAAHGAGYDGSLNLTLDEARALGDSIGSDFYFVGRAEMLRRSASTDSIYYEAYAAVFIISRRTGRLVMFDYTSAEAPTAGKAQGALCHKLSERVPHYRVAVLRACEDEDIARNRFLSSVAEARAPVVLNADALVEEADSPELRMPQPYRRVRPPYTELAARAAIEATVDVEVEVKVDGEVGNIEVQRWAGFGLDDAVTRTVRGMHFRPAMRIKTGEAVPLRVLLRYNFRRPAPSE